MILTNDFGPTFSYGVRAGCGVISLLGVIALIESPVVGVVAICLGLLGWTSRGGAQVDASERKYRSYGSIIGIKYGKWSDMRDLSDVSVLSKRLTATTHSRSNRATSFTKKVHQVFLLNESHRRKVMVGQYESFDKAVEEAKFMADELGLELAKYQPRVQSSRRR